jgi:hypothetical protein
MRILVLLALGAWSVAAWASSHTFRGGPQELCQRPWLFPPLLFSALVKEANERDYYRIKQIATVMFFCLTIAITMASLLHE